MAEDNISRANPAIKPPEIPWPSQCALDAARDAARRLANGSMAHGHRQVIWGHFLALHEGGGDDLCIDVLEDVADCFGLTFQDPDRFAFRAEHAAFHRKGRRR